MNVSLLFPGQGSQEPGMGRDLAENDKDIMELWKKAERASNIALREIYWDKAESDMAATQNLQPALTAVNLALWQKLSAKLTPAATAGHSLGEYSAIAAAGVLPAETVLELVALRGKLMSQADPDGIGTMAALVKLPLATVEECVKEAAEASGEMLVVANYNTPQQFVVSGTKPAIAKVQESAKARKGRAVPLAVSGAFHSPLMQDAATELASAIDAIPQSKWGKARFPVYCNASPHATVDAQDIKSLLKKQMTSSVFWIDTIVRQWNDGCRTFVECGPKEVLAKMVGPILKEQPQTANEDGEAAYSVKNVGSLEQMESFSL